MRAKDAGLEVRGLWSSEVVGMQVSSSSSLEIMLLYREGVKRRWQGPCGPSLRRTRTLSPVTLMRGT